MSKTTALGQKHWKPGCWVALVFAKIAAKTVHPTTIVVVNPPGRSAVNRSRPSWTVWDWIRGIDQWHLGRMLEIRTLAVKKDHPLPTQAGWEKYGKAWFMMVSYLNHWIFQYIIYIYIYIYISTLFAFGSPPVFDFRSFWRRAGENMLRTTVADG